MRPEAQCVAAQHVESWTASILLLQQVLEGETGTKCGTGRQIQKGERVFYVQIASDRS